MRVSKNPDSAGARSPLVLLIPALAGVCFLALPLIAIPIKTPWAVLVDELGSPRARTALVLSLETATAATIVSTVLGVPLAWLLARTNFPGRRMLRVFVALPLVLPPVAGGLSLLLAYGRRGVVGHVLWQLTGLGLPFTTPGVVVAETFVAMPFLVISVEGALRSISPRYEAIAATLGAGRWFTFRSVTLPMVAPGIFAGALLCWARALGEFGATITFAGSFPGTTQTMPLEIYLAFQDDPSAAVALSFVLLVVSAGVLSALRKRWWI
ncbi:MAG: molybdate ABC transporter permease subunit [Acidothermus sp.]|nr:molybdate ABC transporter permease subunit [Acidothermus sp.]MCL6537383.1 ABC transporter permease [Acidothermus sp.]